MFIDSKGINKRATLEELIKFCAKLFGIRQPIKLSIEPEHPDAMAAIRKLKEGSEVDDLTEDYDEIELFIYENKELRKGFSEYHSFVILLSEIIHELTHIKHPTLNDIRKLASLGSDQTIRAECRQAFKDLLQNLL